MKNKIKNQVKMDNSIPDLTNLPTPILIGGLATVLAFGIYLFSISICVLMK
jgi:hypothetical protein